MYGASTSGRGARPAAGTSGRSLADDGPVGETLGRRDGFAARGLDAGAFSAAPTAHGGHGDESIFSTSDGLYQVAKSRTGSSYAGSAHGGSQSGRNGERHSDAARMPPRVAYYGDAPRRSQSMASDEHRGSHHSDDLRADGRGASSEMRARESGDNTNVDDATIPVPADSKQQSRSAKSDSRGDPKQWVRVDDLMRTSLKAETALGKIAEATSAAAQRESPRKQGGMRRVENATQTDVIGMVEPKNPRAQLSFQASLQTELSETQELLIETQMRVKELLSDKKRLVEDLEEATRARVGARKETRGERGAATERDDDDVPDDAMTPTQEEMDETVHSLLEMITAERDKAGALETHLERLTTDLDLEREARLNAQSALAERDAATEEDFSAQERKLREATEIIAELRRALLSVMQVREGSVFGGSAREGGSHRGPGSDGGSSRRSAERRSPRGTPARAANAFTSSARSSAPVPDVEPSRDVSVRPLSSAALARAREDARRRTEEAVRRWERRLEERVDGVVARAVDRACEESLGRGASAALNADDPVLLAVGGSVRAALRDAVEAHAATLVDDMRDATSEDEDARFLDVDSAYAYGEMTTDVQGKTAALGRLTAFLAEEAARRARLRETVAHLREALRGVEREKAAEARLREAREGSERRAASTRANESTVAAVASLAAAEAAVTLNQNEKARLSAARVPVPEVPGVPSFRDLHFQDAVRGARVALRRVTNTPAFELAWPLLLIAMLLRAQIGPDAFAWSSLAR